MGQAGRPLAGRCVLITRARSQAGALAERVEALGGRVWAFPVITVADPESWAPLDEAIRGIGTYQWLVITSPNGAEKFAGRLGGAAPAGAGAVPGAGPPTDAQPQHPRLAHLKVVAVGPATARALAAHGIRTDLIPAEARGAALPAAMAPHLSPGDRVLMARANLADPGPAEALRALGARVDDVVAYRTLAEGGDVAALQAALRSGEIDYVTLTSSSTVGNLIERLGGAHWLSGVRVAVMGPETRKAAEAAGLTVHVMAEQVSLEGLAKAILSDVNAQGRN
jgi:uroporphyrinogen III methyltransferase / synthase